MFSFGIIIKGVGVVLIDSRPHPLGMTLSWLILETNGIKSFSYRSGEKKSIVYVKKLQSGF